MTDRIAELEQQLAQARDHVAELEAYALGCDAEGCVAPHSSWCDVAKKTAAANNGCTCPQPWKDSPQPHAGYCWLLSPPRDEIEQARKRIAELVAERNEFADRVDTLTAVAKGNKRHVQEMFTDLQKAQREGDEARTELAKYVGAEPTIADEMAYLARCLHAVYDLCTEAKRSGSLGITPEAVEQAADGEWTADLPRPALPWAHAMDDSDLHLFLDHLVSAALGRWHSGPEVPDRTVLADIEKVCGQWREPGQGLRSDEDEAGDPR